MRTFRWLLPPTNFLQKFARSIEILRKNACKCFALAHFYLNFESVILIKIREVGNLLAKIYDFAAISRRKQKTVFIYSKIQARKLACKGFRAPCFKKCYRQIYLICRGIAKSNAIYE